MRLLEFESKAILKKYQISTPPGFVVSKYDSLDIQGPVMLKAQIPVGGRENTIRNGGCFSYPLCPGSRRFQNLEQVWRALLRPDRVD